MGRPQNSIFFTARPSTWASSSSPATFLAATFSSVSTAPGNSAIPSVYCMPMVLLTTLNAPVLMVVSSSMNLCGAPTLTLEALKRFHEQAPFGSAS
ncbi:unnamed protein product, partial [Vitis vinifera]|uniref:Uncharacterized protein n=1 Tax=Vitis vinifera TaxID=29760 RepID=D7U741_VITVI